MADDLQLAEATQPLSFAEFLERMKDPAAADLVRFIKVFIKEFDNKPPDPERDSQRVQDFLLKSEAAFRAHPVWASAPGEHQQQAIEGLEKYLMTKIYSKVFAVSESDQERDEALARRMEALAFVRAEHLDIPPAHRDHTAWLLAMKELHKLNNYKAPRDKLVCILNCCRVINNLLHVGLHTNKGARGADDFLPVLIYVLVHANPPQLASNLMYIERFRMHSRMMSESAYFFTQLYSAASFIETINSGSLSMDPDEFVARMVAAGIVDMPPSFRPAPQPPISSSPPFAASFAENGAPVLQAQPPPPPITTAAPGAAADAAQARQDFQSPRAPQTPAGSMGAAADPAATLGLSPAPAQGKAAAAPPGLSPMPAVISNQQWAQPPPQQAAQLAPPSAIPQPQPPQQPTPAEAHVPPTDTGATDGTIDAQASAAASVPPSRSAAAEQQRQAEWVAFPTLSSVSSGGGGTASSFRPASVAELEAEGGPLLANAASSGALAARHTYLHAIPGDLRVGDVAVLLTAYKEAVLHYEALAAAVAARCARAAPPPPMQQQQQPPALRPPPQPTIIFPSHTAAADLPSAAACAAQQLPTAQAQDSPVTSFVTVTMPATLPHEPAAIAATLAAGETAAQGGTLPPLDTTAVPLSPVQNPLFAAASQPLAPAADAGASSAVPSDAAAVPEKQPSEAAQLQGAAAADASGAADLPDSAAAAAAAPVEGAEVDAPQAAGAGDAAAPVSEPPSQFLTGAAETVSPALNDSLPPYSSALGPADEPQAPSDSVRSVDGSAADADAEASKPLDADAEAEAELAALEAELAAERTAVSTPDAKSAPAEPDTQPEAQTSAAEDTEQRPLTSPAAAGYELTAEPAGSDEPADSSVGGVEQAALSGWAAAAEAVQPAEAPQPADAPQSADATIQAEEPAEAPVDDTAAPPPQQPGDSSAAAELPDTTKPTAAAAAVGSTGEGKVAPDSAAPDQVQPLADGSGAATDVPDASPPASAAAVPPDGKVSSGGALSQPTASAGLPAASEGGAGESSMFEGLEVGEEGSPTGAAAALPSAAGEATAVAAAVPADPTSQPVSGSGASNVQQGDSGVADPFSSSGVILQDAASTVVAGSAPGSPAALQGSGSDSLI